MMYGDELYVKAAPGIDLENMSARRLSALFSNARPLTRFGSTPDHHPIKVSQVGFDLGQRFHPAVNRHGQVRKIFLQLVDTRVIQRRNFTVFFRAQAFQPGLARMHNKSSATRLRDCRNKFFHIGILFHIVDTDAVLYRHRNRTGCMHRRDTFSNQSRFGHQYRADLACLHAIAWATAV